jgi:hypothetical protein
LETPALILRSRECGVSKDAPVFSEPPGASFEMRALLAPQDEGCGWDEKKTMRKHL